VAGGGTLTSELTLPGFLHDVCSAIHPLGVDSPAFRDLPLERLGLSWVQPDVHAAHPLDDGSAGVLLRGVDETGDALGDRQGWRRLVGSTVARWDEITELIFGPPLRVPSHPLAVGAFGTRAVLPATTIGNRLLGTPQARGLWSGIASHAINDLSKPLTTASGLVLAAAGHVSGWPAAVGGSQRITEALVAHLESLGGIVNTGTEVRSTADLPSTRAVLFDTTPAQLIRIAGDRLPSGARKRLARFRPGSGAFKVDYAVDAPVPWRNEDCRRAGTVHCGGTMEEVAAAERDVHRGRNPERPFVIVAQQSVMDPSRAPAGKHTVWAYCHVPHGSPVDMADRIEAQIERFAPGFKDTVLARTVLDPAGLEAYNANYIGGDIAGGATDGLQLVARPVLSPHPYRSGAPGMWLCSASTPPGGGVHGLCGQRAAEDALLWLGMK
ncbi:MAG: NAD(P)/FAD-dependent oxidoreductase, partial [Acidimicrobiales bacterium]